MDLESAATELKMLAARERLTPTELDRAKYLIVQLKQLGMANTEIAELTGGRWSESSIKGYSRGVQANGPQPWKSTAALFSEMLSKNLSLTDVSQAMSIATELEGLGSSLGDMVNFIEDLKRNKANITQLKEAINIKTKLEQIGTSPDKIAGFIKELEGEGFDVHTLVSILSDWYEASLTPADTRLALSYKTQLEQDTVLFGWMVHIKPHSQ